MLYCHKLVHRIQELPEKWRLVSASCIYCYRNAKPTPSCYLVVALVQCLIVTCDGSDMPSLSQVDRDFSHQHFLETLHAFAQWQCTYNDAVALNQLLQEPFQYISPACLYSGRVAMHCASLCLHSPIPVLTSNQQEIYDSLMELITMYDTQTRVDKKTNGATKDPQSIMFAHQNPFELPQKKSHSKKGGKGEKPKLVVYLTCCCPLTVFYQYG